MARAQAKSDHAKSRHPDPQEVDNPKTGPAEDGAPSNRIKDPEDWVTGHEPMTGAQASYLKTLAEEAHDGDAYEADLDKAEASKRIDALRAETGKDG